MEEQINQIVQGFRFGMLTYTREYFIREFVFVYVIWDFTNVKCGR